MPDPRKQSDLQRFLLDRLTYHDACGFKLNEHNGRLMAAQRLASEVLDWLDKYR